MTDARIRYARQTSLPQLGDEGQRTLADSRALVVGLGGLGTPASLYLANSGIGKLTICDYDKVDETNLPRQVLYGPGDVGEAKTRAAAAYLWARVPDAEVTEIGARLDETGLAAAVGDCDVVLDCTDNFGSRTLINKVCADQRKTLISGAAIRFEGQLSVFDFARTPRPCYSCLYATEDGGTSWTARTARVDVDAPDAEDVEVVLTSALMLEIHITFASGEEPGPDPPYTHVWARRRGAPKGSGASIDSWSRGRIHLRYKAKRSGLHDVRIEMKGYVTVEREVEISGRHETRLDVVLSKAK